MNTLIINAHPDPASLTSSIARSVFDRYTNKGESVKQLSLSELNFSLNFKGFGDEEEVPKDIVLAQDLIRWADHIVIATPIWWSTYPALLKGFFDRSLLPGFAFKYDEDKALPVKLLTGKTAELILLSDAPAWYRKYILRDPAATVLKRDILGFCGIKVTKVKRIGSVRKIAADERQRILRNI